MGAVSFLCFLVGYFVAGELLEINTWLPFSLAVGGHLLTIPTALALPETLSPVPDKTLETDNSARTSTTEDGDPCGTESPTSEPNPSAGQHSRRRTMLVFYKYVSSYLGFLNNWRMLFLLFTFPVREALGSLDDLYFLYVPKRFGWSIAKTNFIYSFQAAAAIIILLFLCPAISNYLIGRGFSATQKDILIVRVSILIYTIGTLFIASAPTIATLFLAVLIQTCGSGMGSAARALLTTYVKSNEVGKLYTMLGFVEAVSLMIAAPIEASLFNVGMRAGRAVLLGLPWFLMGIFMSLLTIAFWTLSLAKE